MIPTQTSDSANPLIDFPEFSNAGTNIKPDNTKYAAGFVPSDTLPAYWLNWFLHKASTADTAQNAGVQSMESEINSVLAAKNITPAVNVSNQLLTALNIFKAEAILAAHPVGSLYWTSVNENPAVTFGGGTWKQIKDVFVWAKGNTDTVDATGGAKTVTLTTDQIPSHNHTFTGTAHKHTFTGTAVTSTANSRGHTHSVTASGSVTSTFTGNASITDSISATNTGSESSHTHTINSGNTASSGTKTTAGFRFSSGSTNTTGTHHHTYNELNTWPVANGSTSQKWQGWNDNTRNTSDNGSHSHTITSLTGYLYGKTDAGSSHSHNMEHTHSVTASGSVSSTFTGSAVTSGAESQSHTHNVTAAGTISNTTATGTIGNTGGGNAHNNMPPYVVKYCWERTA